MLSKGPTSNYGPSGHSDEVEGVESERRRAGRPLRMLGQHDYVSCRQGRIRKTSHYHRDPPSERQCSVRSGGSGSMTG